MSTDRDRRLAELLHEAAETHHTVFRISDGDDPDWASWYASWLLDLSELPDVLGVRPIRSHLVHALVQLDRDYTAARPTDRWEDWWAARLSAFFWGTMTSVVSAGMRGERRAPRIPLGGPADHLHPAGVGAR